MTEDLQDKLQEKAKSFVAFSIAALESADKNDAPQLTVFICDADETFDVTEEPWTWYPRLAQPQEMIDLNMLKKVLKNLM